MPKPTKLHSKGKASSIQKPIKIDQNDTDSCAYDESTRQFQLELCWCIQQLEKVLTDKKATEKQLQETWKVLTVLKNNQPLIRKRQLMRTHFGDYRSKMAAEEKKLAKMASKMKITESKVQPKATFLRKSAFLTTQDEAFRFNFNLTADQLDKSDNTLDSNTASDTGNTEEKSDSNTDNIIETNKQNGGENNISKEAMSQDNSKTFKFTFSGSDFKFNFNKNDS